MSEGWNEREVFLAALALPPDDREAFLRGACSNEAQRRRIEALLRAHAQGGGADGAPSAPDAAPSQVDEFRIVRLLGEGGMGRVYLAHDTILGRDVALKMLAGGALTTQEALGRFRGEARNAASLKHPGIVPVHKFGECDGRHYIVSEFVDGPTLRAVIDQEAQRRSETRKTSDAREWRLRAANCVAAVADALDYSHRAGLIHRDVKPSNIIIDPELGPRLTDFGIAKRLADESITSPMDLVGSCHYMSPEQASLAERRIDQRSDVFSLGVVLYEMLALRRPFNGEDPPRVLRAVISSEPPRLRAVDPAAPKDLETICLKALEKSPDRRYQSAAHLAADLRCFVAGRPIMARPPSGARRVSRWMLKHRTGVAAAAALAMLLVVGALLMSIRGDAMDADAWFSVEAPVEGCAVYAQLVDPQTLEMGDAVRIGTAPFGRRRLAPGQWRITVVAPDSSWFAEFNALLFEPGRARSRTLVVGDARWRPEDRVGASGGELDSPGHWAVLRAAAVTRRDQDGMALVEAGEYPFGWSDMPAPSIALRTVRLDAFYIDQREVSNAQYHEFTQATGHPPPAIWARYGFDPDTGDLPVVGLTMEDAEAYARWKGKRLPTAHEWQAAVRGAAGLLLPELHGAALSERFREPTYDDILDYDSTDAQTLYDLYRRCSLPAQSGVADAQGLLHTFDNVREFSGTVGSRRHGVVVMGRSWLDSPTRSTLALVHTSAVENSSILHGFRCARSAAPPQPTNSKE